jgi:acetyl esterase/lipase
MRILYLAACAAVTSALTACSPLSVLDAIVPEKGYLKVGNFSYGPLPRQSLDLYLPKTSQLSHTPVVLFFYGGSWRNGKRSHYRFIGQALASRGIAVAVIDYRVYPKVRFPTFVEDGAKAASLVMRLAPKYGIDPNRLFLMGHSAGAHIAALLALDKSYLARAGVPHRSVAGLIGLAGPYAFNPLSYDTSRPVFLPAQNDITKAQPVSHVSSGAPPALLLHGTADETVIPGNSEKLSRALRKAGVRTKEKFYEGIGHIRIILAIAAPFQGDPPVLRDIVDFIKLSIGGRDAQES